MKPTIKDSLTVRQVERRRKFTESEAPATETIYNGEPMPKYFLFRIRESD